MIDRTEATRLMSAWLTDYTGDNAEDRGIELSLLEEKTLEMDFGWVFFYTSRLFRGYWRFQVRSGRERSYDR